MPLNYRYEEPGSRRKSSSGGLRSAVIFVICAGVTCGLLYFVIPGEQRAAWLGATPPPPPPREGENAVTAVPAQEVSHAPVSVPGGAEKLEVRTPGENAELPGVPPAGEEKLVLEVEEAPRAAADAAPQSPVVPAASGQPVPDGDAQIPAASNTGAQAGGSVLEAAAVAGGEKKSASGAASGVLPGGLTLGQGQLTPKGALEFVGAELAAGRLDAAGAGAVKILETADVNSDVYREAVRLLTLVNWERFRLGAPGDPGAEFHQVAAGDSVSRLAVKYRVSPESIRLVNKLKNDNIWVGRRLSVHPGPWRAVIDKKGGLLKIYCSGERLPFLAFEIGALKLPHTPEGGFVVCSKLRRPDWQAADGGIYRYGDSGNPLGGFFLRFAAAKQPTRPLIGCGIHGTPPGGAEKSGRSGGVRLLDAEAEMLYYVVPIGMPVEIAD